MKALGLDPGAVSGGCAIVEISDGVAHTGRANGVYRRLKIAKQAERIRAEPPPLPGSGPYIVAATDIPWAAEPEGDAGRALGRGYWPYPTLTIEQACALPVSKIMAEDAIVWLWVTNFILRAVWIFPC